MGWVLFFGAVGAVALTLAGNRLALKDKVVRLLLLVVGIISITMMGLLAYDIKDGSPATEIEPGVYKVAFVYQAGDNINLGIEKGSERKIVTPATKGREEQVVKYRVEHLYLYQLPAKDFEGEIKTNARMLFVSKVTRVTVGEESFFRYKLE